MKTLAEEMGTRFREIRKKRNETQEAMGKTLGGISKSSVSKYEAGEATPPADIITKYADLGEVSIDWIFTGRDACVHEHAPEYEPRDDDEKQLMELLRAVPEAREMVQSFALLPKSARYRRLADVHHDREMMEREEKK